MPRGWDFLLQARWPGWFGSTPSEKKTKLSKWWSFHPLCFRGMNKQVFCQENISAMNFLHVDQIFLWSGFETAYTITASFNELLGEPKVAKDRRVHLQHTQVGRNARVIVLPTQTTHSCERTPLKIAINFTPLKMGPIYSWNIWYVTCFVRINKRTVFFLNLCACYLVRLYQESDWHPSKKRLP